MMDTAACKLYIIIDLKQPNNLENVRKLVILINDCIAILYLCTTVKLIHNNIYDTFVYGSTSCPSTIVWVLGSAYYSRLLFTKLLTLFLYNILHNVW